MAAYIGLLISLPILVIIIFILICRNSRTYPFKKMKKEDLDKCYNRPKGTKSRNKK